MKVHKNPIGGNRIVLCRRIDRQTDRQKDRQTDRKKDRQTDRQKDRQTDSWANGRMDRNCEVNSHLSKFW
jgi:hypothetical protein